MVDGTTLFHTTFRNARNADKPPADGGFGQSFPDEYPDGRNASQTGATDVGKLGFEADCTYDIELVFPHTEPALLLEFFAGNPGSKDGESYGYRSVEVDAISGPTAPGEAQLEKLWTTLNGKNSLAANKARWDLIAAGKKGADFVRRKQLEANKADPKALAAREKLIADTIAKWIGELDAEAFNARIEARTELKKLDHDAIPALEKELKKTKSPGVRRTALLSIIKSLKAKKKAAGAGSHTKTVAARVAHILRIYDIAASGRKLRASTNWHPRAALDDGFVPLKMTGHTVPHFSWRAKGRAPDQWVQYEYPKARTFNSAMVYWFVDQGWDKGAKLPESWSLVYLDGETWKPVKAKGKYGITYGAFDRVEFDPVTTTAIRLKSKAKAGQFAGLMEFRLGEQEPEPKAEE